MNNKKLHFRLLWMSLVICLFIYGDYFLAPSRFSRAQVSSIYKTVRISGRSRGTWYWMEVNSKKYCICGDMYDILAPGDEVKIFASTVTHANRYIVFRHTTCDVNFLNGSGLIYLSFLSILTVVIMLCYSRITYLPGRLHLSIYCCVSSFALLVIQVMN